NLRTVEHEFLETIKGESAFAIKHGPFQIFRQGNPARLKSVEESVVPLVEFSHVKAEFLDGRMARRAVPAIRQNHSAQIPKKRRDFSHAAPLPHWRGPWRHRGPTAHAPHGACVVPAPCNRPAPAP